MRELAEVIYVLWKMASFPFKVVVIGISYALARSTTRSLNRRDMEMLRYHTALREGYRR